MDSTVLVSFVCVFFVVTGSINVSNDQHENRNIRDSCKDMKPPRWYKGGISKERAESILLERNGDRNYIQPDGAFIVRKKGEETGDFELLVKSGHFVDYFKIRRDEAGNYFIWVVKFDKIHKLVEYHRTTSISRSKYLPLTDMVWLGEVIALYDFQPEDDEELLLNKGDNVLILDDTSDQGWWIGQNCRTGQYGIFPANYVKLI